MCVAVGPASKLDKSSVINYCYPAVFVSKLWHKHSLYWCLFYICAIITTYFHYNVVIMSAMVSQTTSFMIVYSTVYSGTDQRKHQSSASLAFVRGIHWWLVNSPHKGPVTQKMFPFDYIISTYLPVFLCSMAALHQAALVGNTNIMQALLENGIMVDIKDNKGEKNKEISILISVNISTFEKSRIFKCTFYIFWWSILSKYELRWFGGNYWWWNNIRPGDCIDPLGLAWSNVCQPSPVMLNGITRPQWVNTGDN